MQTTNFSMNSKGRQEWAFPKHKQLLTDDFYEDDASHEENPYGKVSVENDFDNYDKATHRATASGVLSKYKKQLNLSPQEVMEKDYMENIKNLR